MSSPRVAEPADALIIQATSTHAPLRLPLQDQSDFVDQFNRTYAAIGLRVERTPDQQLVFQHSTAVPPA